MIDIAILASFLGWCTLINASLLILATVILMLFDQPIKRIHSKISGVDMKSMDLAYFNFLGNYKLAIFMLNLAPYCALRIIS
jgi:Family of unknown function (DUF6868)